KNVEHDDPRLKHLKPISRKEAYSADITYGTNNEFGFDYLRDNMVFSLDEKKQRGLNFAIIDEVDSILIDEARTPLIISGQSEDSSRLYAMINEIAPLIKRQKEENVPDGGHFWVDEKQRSIEINEDGYEFIEQQLVRIELLGEGESLYSPSRLNLLHHVTAAIRAHHLFHRDVHYIVDGEEIVIVDEHTGRTMPGRRWSEGLHQSVEAKEGVRIQNENQTLATTTFQNYFRLYKKLAGMTGTADTEASEFNQIYNLAVVVIPTHKPMVRIDQNDLIFLTKPHKYQAIIQEIIEINKKNAPVLVGTATIESSEFLSKLLTEAGVPHEVLNAKQHAREADIIAQAGSLGAVTIATNMAGRGTDILLGGNWKVRLEHIENATEADAQRLEAEWKDSHAAVLAAGGLHIVGTERHESRRIDNQLRGRAGRQGDPGNSRFYLSLEDDLMRIFAGDRVVNMMRAMGLKEDEAIEHKMVSRSIENAQRKVESRNFDIRKNLLKYDDVANEQRKIIYGQRDDVLKEASLQDGIESMYDDVLNVMISEYIPVGSIDDQWNIEGLEHALEQDFMLSLPIAAWLKADRRLDEELLRKKIIDAAATRYRERRSQMGDDSARTLERHFMLQSLDRYWKEHLAAMDHLRQGIHLRGYAQKNPEQEYKREAFILFQGLLSSIKSEVVQDLSRVHVPTAEELAAMEAQQKQEAQGTSLHFQHTEVDGITGETHNDPELGQVNRAGVTLSGGRKADAAAQPNPYAAMNISRNAPCPCGSGQKYKQCHGKAV
ncbi:MAG: preprotein translocase subunit SecA, partial [Flavobacteriales bacterium]